MAWAQLVRLPNVFTIIADIAAAFLFTAAGPSPISRLVVVILAGVSLYWSGMILNDVFDEAVDRKQRSKRPIPLGWISKREASVGGWVLLALGICLATASGRIPSPEVPTTWLPGIIAVMLAIMIVGYDGPLKSTVLAPAAMGSGFPPARGAGLCHDRHRPRPRLGGWGVAGPRAGHPGRPGQDGSASRVSRSSESSIGVSDCRMS